MQKRGAPDGGKRNLVRWSDTKDQLLLLWIVYACGKHGVKIPFEYVVWSMPDGATEGALSQHLAKLRQRMEADGHHVPPPIPRGSKHRSGVDSTTRSKRKTLKTSKAKNDEDLEDYVLVDEEDMIRDPDGDYGGPISQQSTKKKKTETVHVKCEDESQHSDDSDACNDVDHPPQKRGRIATGAKFLALNKHVGEKSSALTNGGRRQMGNKTIPQSPEPHHLLKIGYSDKPEIATYLKEAQDACNPYMSLNAGPGEVSLYDTAYLPYEASCQSAFVPFNGTYNASSYGNMHTGLVVNQPVHLYRATDLGYIGNQAVMDSNLAGQVNHYPGPMQQFSGDTSTDVQSQSAPVYQATGGGNANYQSQPVTVHRSSAPVHTGNHSGTQYGSNVPTHSPTQPILIPNNGLPSSHIPDDELEDLSDLDDHNQVEDSSLDLFDGLWPANTVPLQSPAPIHNYPELRERRRKSTP